jgi:hypothetical protein
MSGEHANLICTDIRTVSDNTELMLDYGRAEESRFCQIVLRNLRGKAKDSLGRYNCFIVQAYLRLSIAKGRKVIRSNLKWLC